MDFGDGGGGGYKSQVVGTCTDMCPERERVKRQNESDVHRLEFPLPSQTLKETMIKKFQRSSADHELQIADELRTPETLLHTIEYIEEVIMPSDEDELPTYLFIWDRYRMIAKDFTLQVSTVAVSPLWIECHERMVRWFIFMDHSMQTNKDFLSGHAQQNGERLNDFLKSLQTLYNKLPPTSATAPGRANEAEFLAYFVLLQIGNRGEVGRFLHNLSGHLLQNPHLQFVMRVWAAIRTRNFSTFFRLLTTEANLLQACLMHRYLNEMRIAAIKSLARAWATPGASSKASKVPVTDLADALLFESLDETIDFLEHCGYLLSDDGEDVLLDAHHIESSFPLDKNDLPIYPKVKPLVQRIQRNKAGSLSVVEICRGYATVLALRDASAMYTHSNAAPARSGMSTRSSTLAQQQESRINVNAHRKGGASAGGGSMSLGSPDGRGQGMRSSMSSDGGNTSESDAQETADEAEDGDDTSSVVSMSSQGSRNSLSSNTPLLASRGLSTQRGSPQQPAKATVKPASPMASQQQSTSLRQSQPLSGGAATTTAFMRLKSKLAEQKLNASKNNNLNNAGAGVTQQNAASPLQPQQTVTMNKLAMAGPLGGRNSSGASNNSRNKASSPAGKASPQQASDKGKGPLTFGMHNVNKDSAIGLFPGSVSSAGAGQNLFGKEVPRAHVFHPPAAPPSSSASTSQPPAAPATAAAVWQRGLSSGAVTNTNSSASGTSAGAPFGGFAGVTSSAVSEGSKSLNPAAKPFQPFGSSGNSTSISAGGSWARERSGSNSSTQSNSGVKSLYLPPPAATAGFLGHNISNNSPAIGIGGAASAISSGFAAFPAAPSAASASTPTALKRQSSSSTNIVVGGTSTIAPGASLPMPLKERSVSSVQVHAPATHAVGGADGGEGAEAEMDLSAPVERGILQQQSRQASMNRQNSSQARLSRQASAEHNQLVLSPIHLRTIDTAMDLLVRITTRHRLQHILAVLRTTAHETRARASRAVSRATMRVFWQHWRRGQAQRIAQRQAFVQSVASLQLQHTTTTTSKTGSYKIQAPDDDGMKSTEDGDTRAIFAGLSPGPSFQSHGQNGAHPRSNGKQKPSARRSLVSSLLLTSSSTSLSSSSSSSLSHALSTPVSTSISTTTAASSSSLVQILDQQLRQRLTSAWKLNGDHQGTTVANYRVGLQKAHDLVYGGNTLLRVSFVSSFHGPRSNTSPRMLDADLQRLRRYLMNPHGFLSNFPTVSAALTQSATDLRLDNKVDSPEWWRQQMDYVAQVYDACQYSEGPCPLTPVTSARDHSLQLYLAAHDVTTHHKQRMYISITEPMVKSATSHGQQPQPLNSLTHQLVYLSNAHMSAGSDATVVPQATGPLAFVVVIRSRHLAPSASSTGFVVTLDAYPTPTSLTSALQSQLPRPNHPAATNYQEQQERLQSLLQEIFTVFAVFQDAQTGSYDVNQTGTSSLSEVIQRTASTLVVVLPCDDTLPQHTMATDVSSRRWADQLLAKAMQQSLLALTSANGTELGLPDSAGSGTTLTPRASISNQSPGLLQPNLVQQSLFTYLHHQALHLQTQCRRQLPGPLVQAAETRMILRSESSLIHFLRACLQTWMHIWWQERTQQWRTMVQATLDSLLALQRQYRAQHVCYPPEELTVLASTELSRGHVDNMVPGLCYDLDRHVASTSNDNDGDLHHGGHWAPLPYHWLEDTIGHLRSVVRELDRQVNLDAGLETSSKSAVEVGFYEEHEDGEEDAAYQRLRRQLEEWDQSIGLPSKTSNSQNKPQLASSQPSFPSLAVHLLAEVFEVAADKVAEHGGVACWFVVRRSQESIERWMAGYVQQVIQRLASSTSTSRPLFAEGTHGGGAMLYLPEQLAIYPNALDADRIHYAPSNHVGNNKHNHHLSGQLLQQHHDHDGDYMLMDVASVDDAFGYEDTNDAVDMAWRQVTHATSTTPRRLSFSTFTPASHLAVMSLSRKRPLVHNHSSNRAHEDADGNSLSHRLFAGSDPAGVSLQDEEPTQHLHRVPDKRARYRNDSSIGSLMVSPSAAAETNAAESTSLFVAHQVVALLRDRTRSIASYFSSTTSTASEGAATALVTPWAHGTEADHGGRDKGDGFQGSGVAANGLSSPNGVSATNSADAFAALKLLVAQETRRSAQTTAYLERQVVTKEPRDT